MNKLLLILPVGLAAISALWSADEPKKADPVKRTEAAKPEVRWEYATISTGGRANVNLVVGADDVSAESWGNTSDRPRG